MKRKYFRGAFSGAAQFHGLIFICLMVLFSGFSALGNPGYLSIEVQNISDGGAGSLRQAILDLDEGGTITFNSSLNGQTIVLASELDIATGMTIDASALAGGITISGNNLTRVFYIASNSPSVINFRNLKISHGYTGDDGGGVLIDNSLSNVSFTNVSVTYCAAFNGAGIRQNEGTLSLQGCSFSNNAASYNGGALYLKATATISSCTISNNSAVLEAGGLFQEDGNVTNTGSTFSGNTGSWGGSYFFRQHGDLLCRGAVYR